MGGRGTGGNERTWEKIGKPRGGFKLEKNEKNPTLRRWSNNWELSKADAPVPLPLRPSTLFAWSGGKLHLLPMNF